MRRVCLSVDMLHFRVCHTQECLRGTAGAPPRCHSLHTRPRGAKTSTLPGPSLSLCAAELAPQEHDSSMRICDYVRGSFLNL